MPERIANAPELKLGLELFYTAFLELSTCRNSGMGVGPIPWTAVHTYCVYHDFDDELRNDLNYFVNRLDAAYIEYQNKQAEK